MLNLKNEKKLSAMAKLECETCQPDIRQFYDISTQIIDLNSRLVTMAADHPQGSKSLSAGRVVVLRDDVGTSSFRLNGGS